jgi:hypothetical protein
MDERGRVPRNVKFGREANVGETCENARRVQWKRCRIFLGRMTDHKILEHLIEGKVQPQK